MYNQRLYPWRVTLFYVADVKPPKIPKGLAIRVEVSDEHARDLEVKAGQERSDIGKITVEWWNTRLNNWQFFSTNSISPQHGEIE